MNTPCADRSPHEAMLTYFAYGSNMSMSRLGARVPSAHRLAVGRLQGYRLAFHKVGRDGSGKCDIVACRDSVVFGTLYGFDADEKPLLDAFEDLGRGYSTRQIAIERTDGSISSAFTYTALIVDPNLRPYHWYHRHVLVGAVENNLPAHYVAQLRAAPSIDDPDAARHAREMAVHAAAK